ncbi:MAG: sugar O-acetyltransferase [Cyclobacteriaceae bacterium]|nr:sugar O-acetyltransferase [Cyclobacteriaceae bacterium]
MKTEKEKMLAGELYDASDSHLTAERRNARLLCKNYNDSTDEQILLRKEILRELIGGYSKGLVIEPPFYCDYGSNISVGEKVYFNFNCVVLDVNKVMIGSNVLFGPYVQIYTATHPMDYKIRAEWLELGKPITIGSDIWVGGGAIICPGVTIGDRSVIGAGSVVTRDIPSDTFAAGNPCKVIKSLNQEE